MYLVKASVFILFILLQFNALGAQNQSIQLVAGLSKPPFVIEPNKNFLLNKNIETENFIETKKGMQIDVIKAAFAISNYEVNFIHLPLGLHMGVYKRRNLDGLVTLSEQESELGVYLSEPYINYQNVVVSLAKKNFNISLLSHLSDIRVAAFQNATKLLGDKFSNIVEGSVSYIELAEQKSQLALLFNERVDAIVMDINIFKYLLIELQSENNNTELYTKKVTFHPLFQPRNYVAGFKTKELKNLFDKGIAKIKATGQYQKIVDSYLTPAPSP